MKLDGPWPESALDSTLVAFPFGKPVSTFPGNALSARRFGEEAEHGENHRLSFEMEDLDIPRGAVELVPYLRHLRKATGALRHAGQPRGEPVPDRIDEGVERPLLGAPEGVAQRMERLRVDGGQSGEQLDHPLAQGQRRAAQQRERAGDASVRSGRSPGD